MMMVLVSKQQKVTTKNKMPSKTQFAFFCQLGKIHHTKMQGK